MKCNFLLLMVSLLLPLAASADDNSYFEFCKGNDGIRYKCCYKGPNKGIAYVLSFDREL